ncbi:hypothetical protein [Streptomyces seoulensis]|uniref:hypothetical protein n=1 Tax=Streptomyces seoulensis TaxID=73044 RepID=UPI001FCC374A|nr:hypothetical protein [Streptomyces seoulensis]BDH06702.1 hypothetical protein HEK131_39290 [Streptomyces seoulensis]
MTEQTQGGPQDAAVMLTSLQTTHQLADGKAGVLAGVQAALVVSFGPWVRTARSAWAHHAVSGALLDGLVVLFAVAFVTGVGCLALVLRPRLWRPASFNRFSVRALSATATAPGARPGPGPEGTELWEACRFMAAITVKKCRYAAAAIACTAAMAVTAGLCVLLRAFSG